MVFVLLFFALSDALFHHIGG